MSVPAISRERRIAVIGLGYVGLPLAVEFGRKFPTIGFDINPERIAQIRAGNDVTREVPGDDLRAATRLGVTSDVGDPGDCSFFVITVPTPITPDKRPDKRPDLGPLRLASATVGSVLKKGDIVVFESTVYPGATEE